MSHQVPFLTYRPTRGSCEKNHQNPTSLREVSWLIILTSCRTTSSGFSKKKTQNQCDPKKGSWPSFQIKLERMVIFVGGELLFGMRFVGWFLLFHSYISWSHEIVRIAYAMDFSRCRPNSSTSGSLSSGRKAPGKSSGNPSGTFGLWMDFIPINSTIFRDP